MLQNLLGFFLDDISVFVDCNIYYHIRPFIINMDCDVQFTVKDGSADLHLLIP
jgi:hypothetical protein